MRKFLSSLLFVVICGLNMSSSWAADITPPAVSHEQQWIVNSIGKDIAEIVLFAAKQDGNKEITLEALTYNTKEAPGNSEQFSYQLQWDKSNAGQTRDFTLVDYLWNPDNYAPWAEQLIKSCKLQAFESAESPLDSYISGLSNFASETIAQENKRISAALMAHPLDAGMHEQAALLCSLFALRESAACFSDVRPSLNRIATHLAIAKALKGKTPYGTAGKLSEATLMCLCGHEAEGVERIDAMKSDPNQATQSWLRALKIRATNDYRIADLKKASVLERLQYGRALADDIGSDYLTDYLQKNKPEGPAIDWLRIGSRGVSSVQSGHIYTEPGVGAELQSFTEDLKLYKSEPIKSSSEANAALSLPAGRCLVFDPTPELQVISWPDVSAFHARHVLDSLFQRYYFEQKMWGVPDQAQEFAEKSDKSFAEIKLYPLYKACRLWVDGKKCDAELTAQLKQLLLDRPEDINSTLWHRILKVSATPTEFAPVTSWFTPRFLFGTAFDFPARNFDEDPDLTLGELDKLKSVSPYSRLVTYNWAATKYPHESYTSQQLTDAFGSLAEVDINAMHSIAQASKSDPTKYAEQLEKIAKYKPDSYFALGNFYVHQSQPEKAKEAFEAGIRLGRDSVAMSNSCSWLVNYYFDHGEKDKAYKLAESVAAVYSAVGLKTMAKLCERMGKLPEAADYYIKIRDRYDDEGGLCLFYNRHAKENANYKQEGERLLKNIFPAGQIKIDPASLTGKPENGILVTSNSPLTEKFGIHYRDVFVGIDGVRIDTKSQYFYLLEANADANQKMKFTVWNGKEYRTVEAVLPDHRWGCSISLYKPQQ